MGPCTVVAYKQGGEKVVHCATVCSLNTNNESEGGIYIKVHLKACHFNFTASFRVRTSVCCSTASPTQTVVYAPRSTCSRNCSGPCPFVLHEDAKLAHDVDLSMDEKHNGMAADKCVTKRQQVSGLFSVDPWTGWFPQCFSNVPHSPHRPRITAATNQSQPLRRF